MKTVTAAAGLLASTSISHAAEPFDIVQVFIDACMGSRSAYETIDALGEARGWARPDTKGAGRQGAIPTDSSEDHAQQGRGWIVLPPMHPGGQPEMFVAVMRFASADHIPRETCSVTKGNFRSDETTSLLQHAFGENASAHRRVDAQTTTTQWILNRDRMDGVALFEQENGSKKASHIIRGRKLDKEAEQ